MPPNSTADAISKQTEILAAHVDSRFKDYSTFLEPFIAKTQSLDAAINGNGAGDGLKTTVKILNVTQSEIQKDLEELKQDVKKIQQGLLWGGVFIVVLQIVLRFI